MRKAKKQDSARDPQREAVYDLESSFHDFNRETLTLAEAREWVGRACRHFKLKPPTVRQHKYGMAFSVTATPPDGSYISFVPQHKNPAIALHEAAHYIAETLYGPLRQDHGPSWLGVYCWLLVECRVVPAAALLAELRKRKLKYRKICRDLLRKF